MDALLLFLSLLGGVALLVRFIRALLRLGLAAAEETAASGMAEVSARHGDITALSERQAASRAARAVRRQALLQAAAWLLLLLLPLVFGWAREVYAAAAILWLFPTTPVRAIPR